MSLVMDNVLQGRVQYSTFYAQCATGTESLLHLIWKMCHWDRLIKSLVMDNVPLGQSHY